MTDESAARAAGVALTNRETQIAFWIGEGKTNHEIGLILSIGTRTVEKHVEHVLAKLGVENRTTAALRLRDDPALSALSARCMQSPGSADRERFRHAGP